MQVPAGDRAPQFSPLLSRPPQFVSQNAGCPSPRSFTAISFVRQPGEMGFPSKAEDELELSGQGTEGDCDGGTARGSARSRGRGTGTPRPPSSGNSGHCRGCSVRGWTGYRQKQLSDRMKDGGRPDRTLSERRWGRGRAQNTAGQAGGWAGHRARHSGSTALAGFSLRAGRGTRSPRGRRRRGAWLGVGGDPIPGWRALAETRPLGTGPEKARAPGCGLSGRGRRRLAH